MKRVITIALVFAAIALAATRVYDIEPYKNVNAWSPYQGYIGQTFIATCDSFVWAEIFIGSQNIPGQYHFEIREGDAQGPLIASGDTNAGPGISYQYVRAYLTHRLNAKVIKGKTYLLKITHSGGDSINYYYNPHNPYKYGQIMLPQGGAGPVHPWDLAARIEGINKVDGPMLGCAIGFSEAMGRSSAYYESLISRAKEAGVPMSREGFYWDRIRDSIQHPFNFYKVDTLVGFVKASVGAKIIGLLAYNSSYAATRTTGDPISAHQ